MIKAEISRSAIYDNIKQLRGKLRRGVKICAVVKANAYSLGDKIISRLLNDKVDCFAVVKTRELANLRTAGITKDVLLLGVCEDYETAINLGGIITIGSSAELLKLAAKNRPARVHIKVDCGMNRFGLKSILQLKKLIEICQGSPLISVEGLYSHCPFEADNPQKVKETLNKFNAFVRFFKNFYPSALIHFAASGTSEIPECQFDMVRVGKLLYGGYGGYKTAVKISGEIVVVKTLKKGESVGYDGTFIAPETMRIGVVACGYADIVNFKYKGTNFVTVDGKPVRVLGRVCMDYFFVDVREIKKPLGKSVVIISNEKGQRVMDIAAATGICACETFCGMNFTRAEVRIT
ncbi:MAG: alanine racemase [Christensenellaceae bacterium]|jgi:alanine racemase|nr:alanine racemase [Christensenellaceae bacterium]